MKTQTLTRLLVISLILVLYSYLPDRTRNPAVRPDHPPLRPSLEEELYRQMVHGPTRHLHLDEDSVLRVEDRFDKERDQRGGLE